MSSFTKRQKEIFLIVLASIFLVSIVAYSYFLVYSPIKESTDQVKQTVESERNVLFTLRKEAAEQEQADSSSTLRSQQKVPVKPLEDAVLLQVTKAEIKSGSAVKNVHFSKRELDLIDAPENVENIFGLTTTVELEVDTYDNLIKFIEEIEQMERIFIVDSIEFAGPDEVKEIETIQEIIPLKVSFTAFYRADLNNLIDEVPKVNAPSASQKVNPFSFNKGTEEGEE